MENPKISALMAVHNGEKYLRKAVNSILAQSFADFEFLIIDDASTDGTAEILASFGDPRIRIIKNKEGIGLARSLNKGINVACGVYIARMDADDVSHSGRFTQQVAFLDAHPDVGLVGTWAKAIGDKRKKYIKPYTSNEHIKAQLIFQNAFVHPSVMMRKSMFDAYHLRYGESLPYSQDYDLWTRAVEYFPARNIPKFLVFYRFHDEHTTRKHQEKQRVLSDNTKIRQLEKVNIEPTEEEKMLHISKYTPSFMNQFTFLEKQEQWSKKLIAANRQAGYADEQAFAAVVATRFLVISSANAGYDFSLFRYFWHSTLRQKLDWSDFETWKVLTRFFLKCMLKRSTISAT